MFQFNSMANRDMNHEPETIIAASVKVEGDFASQGNVLIEGVLEGSLKTERDLRVGERARIDADVYAANAVIAGEVRGNIVVAERLELEPTARLYGDVKTKILVISSGAALNGKISMGQETIIEERPAKAVKTEVVEKKVKAMAAAVSEKEEVEDKKTFNAFFTR